jgi:predicted Zn finger-like uncharacterized protein
LIAACPQCQTRFRLAKEKIGPQGARIRCSSCQTIFRVQSPDPGVVTPTPSEARPSPVAAPAPPPAPPAPPKPLPPLAHALVIEADPEVAKGIADLLTSWRISSTVVDDGGAGLLAIVRKPPALAVLGAGLASLTAPQIAEIVRRNAELITVKLVRVAVSDEPPAGDHDAEEMLEPADLPAGLAEILARFALGAKPSVQVASKTPPVMPPPMPPKPVAAPAPVAPVAAKPVVAPSAPAPVAEPAKPTVFSRPVPSSDPEIAAAERLARIAVSDVILYNEAKFTAAAQSGNVAKALASELEEARQHFNSRVSPVLRQKRDFLNEELERRAAQRKT